MNIETIEREGQLFAVIPLQSYTALLEDSEMLEDIAAFDAATIRAQTALPAEVWDAMERGVGEGIIALRAYRGMTQKALAERAGIKQPYLSAIESGKKPGSALALTAIAKVLGVTVEDVLG
jgi:DNA-binding XRE family transcriptional regulator